MLQSAVTFAYMRNLLLSAIQNLAPLTVEMNLYRAADTGKSICFAANSSISIYGRTKHAYLI